MSKSKGSFWANLFNPGQRDRFSLDELQYLHEVLVKSPVIHDGNRDVVVEALRSIAELMIWGDQHEPKFFEFFLERNVMGHFARILNDPVNRRGEVAVQVS